jgi:hypothetical protein
LLSREFRQVQAARRFAETFGLAADAYDFAGSERGSKQPTSVRQGHDRQFAEVSPSTIATEPATAVSPRATQEGRSVVERNIRMA